MDGWTLNLFTAPRDEAETAAREMKVRAAEENIIVWQILYKIWRCFR